MPEPEQVADFFEGRVLGQIVDVIPAIGEHSRVAVDVANAGCGGNNAFQSLGCLQARYARHLRLLGLLADPKATFFYTPDEPRFPDRPVIGVGDISCSMQSNLASRTYSSQDALPGCVVKYKSSKNDRGGEHEIRTAHSTLFIIGCDTNVNYGIRTDQFDPRLWRWRTTEIRVYAEL